MSLSTCRACVNHIIKCTACQIKAMYKLDNKCAMCNKKSSAIVCPICDKKAILESQRMVLQNKPRACLYAQSRYLSLQEEICIFCKKRDFLVRQSYNNRLCYHYACNTCNDICNHECIICRIENALR